jgi:precorrin-3B methylase
MDQKGTVIEVEEEVPFENIPSRAKSAIEKAASGGKVLKVESVVHGAAVVAYEAQVQRGSKRSEVRVSPEGKPAPE